ncbi:MAG TPA: hypothetical protein VIK78_03250 [Ruminiclostridium sp.]
MMDDIKDCANCEYNEYGKYGKDCERNYCSLHDKIITDCDKPCKHYLEQGGE